MKRDDRAAAALPAAVAAAALTTTATTSATALTTTAAAAATAAAEAAAANSLERVVRPNVAAAYLLHLLSSGDYAKTTVHAYLHTDREADRINAEHISPLLLLIFPHSRSQAKKSARGSCRHFIPIPPSSWINRRLIYIREN